MILHIKVHEQPNFFFFFCYMANDMSDDNIVQFEINHSLKSLHHGDEVISNVFSKKPTTNTPVYLSYTFI